MFTITYWYAGNSEGAASLTADLVDLGYVRLVTWIILNLVDRDRSDIVVEVSTSSTHHVQLQIESKNFFD